MSDPMVRHLARELAAMRDRIRAMEVASQAAFRSIEGGSIDVYDDETDELLGRIGVQRDGSIGVDIKTGKKPEAPTEPDVNPIPGGAIVAWDGRFEDRQSSLVIDRIAVHMDETPGFDPDRDTEVAAIRSTGSGGTAVIPIDDGAEWYVKLIAVSKGGVWSDPSAEVHVAAVESEVAFFQDEFTLTADGAQDVTLTYRPISFSEHLYWNGLYQPEDQAWTREGQVVSLIGSEIRAGDTVAVEYAYLPVDEFVQSSEAVNSNDVTSLTISPPPSVEEGDILLLASARWDVATPAGWTLLASVQSTSLIGAPLVPAILRVFTKTATANESPVTISGGQAGARCAVMVAYRGVQIGEVQTNKQDPASGAFTPATVAGNRLVLALYDGAGTAGSGDEVISVNGGLNTRHNLNAANGQFSLVAAEGSWGDLTDATPGGSDTHFWLNVSIGLG